MIDLIDKICKLKSLQGNIQDKIEKATLEIESLETKIKLFYVCETCGKEVKNPKCENFENDTVIWYCSDCYIEVLNKA